MADKISMLARRLDTLAREVRARSTQPQLANSSIEDGSVDVYVDDTQTMIVGQQHDGTSGAIVVNGPVPPTPTVPLLTPEVAGLRLYWDGTYEDDAVAPSDWAKVLAYAVPTAEFVEADPLDQTHIVGSFGTALGGEFYVSLPQEEHIVFLVCFSQSGRPSAASMVAFATPLPFPESGGVTDPPSESPALKVTGTTSSLIVEAADVEAGTEIDYHISDVEDFTPDSTTLYTPTTATILVIQGLPDGTPLVPEGVYYLRALAHNVIGDAPDFSPQTAASLNLSNVDQVVAASLVTGFILTGQIQIGQILIDAATGISINQPGGGYILKFPANGIDPLELTAQIVTNKLNVEDNLSIAGNAQLLGDFQMSNGITNPSSQPTLGNYYPNSLIGAFGDGTTDLANIYHGMVESPSDSSVFAICINFFGAGIRFVNKYTGDLAIFDPTAGKGWVDNFYPWGGITYLDGHYYVFGQDNDRPVDFVTSRCFLYKIDATTFDKVDELELWDTSVFGEYHPRLTTDGTGIYIFWMNSGKNLRFRRTTASLGAWGTNTLLDTLGARRPIADVQYGTYDGIGSPRFWVALDGGPDPVMAWTATTDGPNTRSSTYDFEKATNGMIGLTYDTNRNQMMSLDRNGFMYRYGKYPTDKSIIGKYAWLDDNATGGTHETVPGPPRTQNIKARGYLNTTVGSPPDLNNTDALNTDKANKVAAYFSDDGGSTWKRRVHQKDRTASITTANGTKQLNTFGQFLESDVGATVTHASLPAGTKILRFISTSIVLVDQNATASTTQSATLTPANPWSSAYASLAELSSGTPKTTNQFLSSTVATPGVIRSTAETTAIDGMTTKVYLNGAGMFRLGNYTHVRHFASRWQAGAQNIPTSTWTVMSFGSDLEPSTGVTWDTTNSRFIINKPGVYAVNLSVQWASNTNGTRRIGIYKNGNIYAAGDISASVFTTSLGVHNAVALIPLEAGDYLDAQAWHNVGSTIQVNSGTNSSRHYFSVAFVGT